MTLALRERCEGGGRSGAPRSYALVQHPEKKRPAGVQIPTGGPRAPLAVWGESDRKRCSHQIGVLHAHLNGLEARN
jgi:hypothetical protein